MASNLIIFDVDGTLTDTACIDSAIFSNTFINYLGIERLNSSWDKYQYSTDSGLALEIFKKYLCRFPNDEEIDAIKEDFFNSLLSKIMEQPTCCNPIFGAKSIFNRVLQTKNWDTAIATGGWQRSALTKLKYAEINYHRSPFASSDDHVERYEIINTAIERSKQHYAKDSYHQVIYIGDRQWDYEAAQYLGIGFIGIGQAFFDKGFNIPVIENYADDDFISLLNYFAAGNTVTV